MPIKRRPSSKSSSYDGSLHRLRTDVARYVLGDESQVKWSSIFGISITIILNNHNQIWWFFKFSILLQEINHSSDSIEETCDIKSGPIVPTNKANLSLSPPTQTQSNPSTATIPSNGEPTYAPKEIYLPKDTTLPITGKELITYLNSTISESSSVHFEENESHPIDKNNGFERKVSCDTSKAPDIIFPNVFFIILFMLFCCKWGLFLIRTIPLCMAALILLDYLKAYS